MQEVSRKRVSFECSSHLSVLQFTQRWHIADFKCLADLTDSSTRYESCAFSHPFLKNFVYFMTFHPPDEIIATGTSTVTPSIFVNVKSHTDTAPFNTVNYRVANIIDDDTAKLLFSNNSCEFGGDQRQTGWGRYNVPVEIHREDGALVLLCSISALIRIDQSGIEGALCGFRSLARPILDFACILSNVASTCQEWHISDVKIYAKMNPGKKIEGEEFTLPSLQNASWSLNLFPNGKDEETKGNMSLYLHLKTDDASLSVRARFQFFAVFENGDEREISDVLVREFQSDDDGQTFGIDKCSSSDFLRKDGSLRLKCELSTLICDPSMAKSIPVTSELLVPAEQTKMLHDKLSTCLTKMVDSGYASDFVIKVGSTEFSVHRAILGCRSKVFRAMLDSCLEEAKSSQLQISDFPADAVKLMIRYIYVGTLPDDELVGHVKELVGLADKYELPDLKLSCELKISSKLVPENVIEAIFLADTYKLTLVRAACMNFFLPSTRDQVIQSEAWAALKKDHPNVALGILESAGMGTRVDPVIAKRIRFE